MTKLEKLYQSIANLKELGLPLHDETLKAVDNLEEELITNEVIPRLADTIEPIIKQIQRPIVLVVDYVPEESLSVRLTRKRVITDETETKQYSLAPIEKDKTNKTNKAHTFSPKSPKTGLKVTFPDGTIINRRFAYETLLDTIEKIGISTVENLHIKHLTLDLISKVKDDFYHQHEINGYLILTHSSTIKKYQQIEEISKKLNLNLKIEVI
jgi:hypothetical protein